MPSRDRPHKGSRQREGFKDLIARVTLDKVDIILSYEVIRLARNCSDWYPLLNLCGYPTATKPGTLMSRLETKSQSDRLLA